MEQAPHVEPMKSKQFTQRGFIEFLQKGKIKRAAAKWKPEMFQSAWRDGTRDPNHKTRRGHKRADALKGETRHGIAEFL